jgi:hypothetical protein
MLDRVLETTLMIDDKKKSGVFKITGIKPFYQK